MKYLNDYIEEAQTQAFKEAGSFFAFSNKQFDEAKKEGIVYCNMGGGLICPEDNVATLADRLLQIAEDGIKTDIKENGKKGIIHRELANHEYCITHDITDTVEKLRNYGITPEEIRAEVGAYLKDYYEWEESQNQKQA